jgi:allantoinase
LVRAKSILDLDWRHEPYPEKASDVTEPRLVVRGRRVVLADGIGPATVRVDHGVITSIDGHEADSEDANIVDAGDDFVMPGVVDTHVHVNEPGRTDWEGFETATRAAAAGGVTTIVDMPLNSIPATTTVDALHEKVTAARGKCAIDVGFWGGVVPGNGAELEPLLEAGVLGFKAFLVPSGVPEFEATGDDELGRAMEILARRNAVLLVHAEDEPSLDTIEGRSRQPYSDYLASRPPACEERGVARLIDLSRATGCRVHVVHLASATALDTIRAAKECGTPLTVETCPHYLTFAAEEIDDGDTTCKCAPPIRETDHRDALWAGLADGTIDLVASDHSPCPPDLKQIESGNFVTAWGGIASLQLSLAAVWTAARGRGFDVDDMVRWMCDQPARLAGLESRKGAIAIGRDGDLVIWDPDQAFTVDAEKLHHRHALTPYQGRTLYGRVEQTFLRGQLVYDRGAFAVPSGQWLKMEG